MTAERLDDVATGFVDGWNDFMDVLVANHADDEEPTEFSKLNREAQMAIVDTMLGVEVKYLSESVREEIRNWAMIDESEGME